MRRQQGFPSVSVEYQSTFEQWGRPYSNGYSPSWDTLVTLGISYHVKMPKACGSGLRVWVVLG